MDLFHKAALQRLTSHTKGPCVSLYMPTHPRGNDGEQDAIRLKNLLRDAETKLSGHWMRGPDAKALVKRAGELPQDPTFWQKRGQGLAVFIAPGVFEVYRLSVPFAARVSVGHRFRLRPLLPQLERQVSFLLLTLSENQVALYAVHEKQIEPIEVPGLPASLAKSLNLAAADRGSQIHTAMHGVTGKQAAVFHGQGGQPDTTREEQLAYCTEIDRAVSGYLEDSKRPLLLAGVERLTELYRRRSSYKYVLAGTFTGNHDRKSEHELHRGAWQIAEPLLRGEAEKFAARYAELAGTGMVSNEPREVVAAAIQGRVDSLVYDPKAELFGEYAAPGGHVQVTGNADDDDLVDLAAVETLQHGGEIFAMTGQAISTNSPLAAILRYPTAVS